MLAALRSGSFVTRERMRAYSLLLLVAYVATIVVLLATADGIVDAAGRPLGTDFANIYAAGKLALAGEPALAYDWPAHHAMQKRISGREDIGYYGWHYPPAFLLVALVLAATGRWRVIAAAAAAALAIAGLTWAFFGADVFAAFWQSLPMTQRVILEGAPGFYKIQSVYAALRQLGVPGTFANSVQ